MNENDFKKRFGGNSPLPPYIWSDDDYARGWDITGDMPPTRQQFDALQRSNDDKAAYLLDKVYSSARLLRRSTHYNKGDRVYAEGLKAGLYLECATAGMSGTDAIDFSLSKVGDTITDGGVTWTVVKYALTTDVPPLASALATPRKIELTGNVTGSADFDGSKDIQIVAATNGSLGYRQSSKSYTVGQIAYHSALPAGYYLECTTGGTTSSGDLTISSPGIGGTVNDGSVMWKVCKDIGTGNAPIYAGFNKKQTFTSSGSFTATVTGAYKITLQGGGGGGGGAGTPDVAGGIHMAGGQGGQGGHYEFYETLTAGTTYSFTIGAGGSGGAAGSASVGHLGSRGADGGNTAITINSISYVATGGNSRLTGSYDGSNGGNGGLGMKDGVVIEGTTGCYGTAGGHTANNFLHNGWLNGFGGGLGGGGGYIDARGAYKPGIAGQNGYITFEWLDPTL